MIGIINIIIWVILVIVAAAPTAGIASVIIAWCVFIGASGRARKALEKLNSTLMPDEKVIEYALQHRAYALLGRRKRPVAATRGLELALK